MRYLVFTHFDSVIILLLLNAMGKIVDLIQMFIFEFTGFVVKPCRPDACDQTAAAPCNHCIQCETSNYHC
jgi:hypothetical protein